MKETGIQKLENIILELVLRRVSLGFNRHEQHEWECINLAILDCRKLVKELEFGEPS
jgi:hypothetical protein